MVYSKSLSFGFSFALLELWLNTEFLTEVIWEVRAAILKSKSTLLVVDFGDLLVLVSRGVAGFEIGFGINLVGIGSIEL